MAPKTSKSWTSQDGKGLIYKVLTNRTYLGELRHKELWYGLVFSLLVVEHGTEPASVI